MGKTIMVSSHILPELADICNKVGIIERGELLFNGTVADVMKQVRQRMLLNVGVVGDQEPAARLLEQSPLVEKVELNDGHISVTLAENVTDYSDLPTAADRRRLQAEALPRRRAKPRNGVHGADQGDYGVMKRLQQ